MILNTFLKIQTKLSFQNGFEPRRDNFSAARYFSHNKDIIVIKIYVKANQDEQSVRNTGKLASIEVTYIA